MRRLASLTNSAFLFGSAETINRLINLVAMMIASRHYGVAEFGRLGAAIALTGILTVLTNFIAAASLTRDLCQRPERKVTILTSYLWHRLIVMVASGALLALGFLLAEPKLLALNLFCYLYLYGIQTVMSARAGLMAQERFGEASVSSVTHSLLILTGAYMPVRFGLPLEMMALALAAAQVVSLAVVLILSGLHGYPLREMLRQRIDWPYILSDLKRNIPLWLALVFISAYCRLNAVLCQAIRGDYETGLFTAAHRLFLGFGLIISVYQQVTYPRMVRDVASEEPTARYMEGSGRVVVTIAQFIALVTTLCGVRLMAALWGREFGASGGVVQILIWALALSFTNFILLNVLVARGRLTTLMWVTFTGLCFSIVANIPMIIRFGAAGAAATAILTEAVVLGGMLVALRQYRRACPLLSAIVRSLVAAGAAVFAAIGARQAGVAELTTLAMGPLLYFAGVWVLRVIRRRDLADIFRRLMPEADHAAPRPAGRSQGGPDGGP